MKEHIRIDISMETLQKMKADIEALQSLYSVRQKIKSHISDGPLEDLPSPQAIDAEINMHVFGLVQLLLLEPTALVCIPLFLTDEIHQKEPILERKLFGIVDSVNKIVRLRGVIGALRMDIEDVDIKREYENEFLHLLRSKPEIADYIPISPQDAVFASASEITKPGGFLRGDSLFPPLNSTGYTARSLSPPRDFLRGKVLTETSILKGERYIPEVMDEKSTLSEGRIQEIVRQVCLSKEERDFIKRELADLVSNKALTFARASSPEEIALVEATIPLRNVLMKNFEPALLYLESLIEESGSEPADTTLLKWLLANIGKAKVEEENRIQALKSAEDALALAPLFDYSVQRETLNQTQNDLVLKRVAAVEWPSGKKKERGKDKGEQKSEGECYKIFKIDSGGHRAYCFTPHFRVHGKVVMSHDDERDPQNYDALKDMLTQALEHGEEKDVPLSEEKIEKVKLFLYGFNQELENIGKLFAMFPFKEQMGIPAEGVEDRAKEELISKIFAKTKKGSAAVEQGTFSNLYFDKEGELCLDILQTHDIGVLVDVFFPARLDRQEMIDRLTAALPEDQRHMRVLTRYRVGAGLEDGLQFVSSDNPFVAQMLSFQDKTKVSFEALQKCYVAPAAPSPARDKKPATGIFGFLHRQKRDLPKTFPTYPPQQQVAAY